MRPSRAQNDAAFRTWRPPKDLQTESTARISSVIGQPSYDQSQDSLRGEKRDRDHGRDAQT